MSLVGIWLMGLGVWNFKCNFSFLKPVAQSSASSLRITHCLNQNAFKSKLWKSSLYFRLLLVIKWFASLYSHIQYTLPPITCLCLYYVTEVLIFKVSILFSTKVAQSIHFATYSIIKMELNSNSLKLIMLCNQPLLIRQTIENRYTWWNLSLSWERERERDCSSHYIH